MIVRKYKAGIHGMLIVQKMCRFCIGVREKNMENRERKQREIRAVFDQETIRVYQAYNPVIAKEAVELQTFGSHFSRTRMTWIKPSFLWMMYRCGWAEKEGQEHVLAIDIKREAFDKIVQQAVLSTYQEQSGMSMAQWKEMIKTSDIRCQWDPERDIYGNPLPYRSIQLGIRGKAVEQYVEGWIVKIEDITDYVRELNEKKRQGIDIMELLPKEISYPE